MPYTEDRAELGLTFANKVTNKKVMRANFSILILELQAGNKDAGVGDEDEVVVLRWRT